MLGYEPDITGSKTRRFTKIGSDESEILGGKLLNCQKIISALNDLFQHIFFVEVCTVFDLL